MFNYTWTYINFAYTQQKKMKMNVTLRHSKIKSVVLVPLKSITWFPLSYYPTHVTLCGEGPSVCSCSSLWADVTVLLMWVHHTLQSQRGPLDSQGSTYSTPQFIVYFNVKDKAEQISQKDPKINMFFVSQCFLILCPWLSLLRPLVRSEDVKL